MITLSIRQPWAWLILRPDIAPENRETAFRAGSMKDIENRDWPTKYRGEFLIHAGKQMDDGCRKPGQYVEFQRLSEDSFGVLLPARESLQLGGIVGKARITDCVSESDSPWFFGKFGFVIADAMPLPFMPCPGKLSFFETDYRLPVPG